MVKPLPAGCRLITIFDFVTPALLLVSDCVHPFSPIILRNPLDLPYLYSTKGKIKELHIAQESAEGSKGKLTSYAQRGAGWLVGGGIDLFRTNIAGAQKVDRYIKRVRAIPDVVSTLLSWNVPFDLPL